MTKSMTAYAQASINTEMGELSCELRSVNHRYLEIAPRMPEELRIHEPFIREAIANKLARGRIDCFIRVKENEEKALEPNPKAIKNLQNLLHEAQSLLHNMQDIRAIDVLRWPGVLQTKEVNIDALRVQLGQMVEKAVNELIASREREGEKMAELICQRLASMRDVIEKVTEFLPEIAVNYRTRLDEKLVEIKDHLDPARIEQEMIMFLQKTDVAEELDRLDVHISEVEAVLSNSEPAGRRLDFLMQELNREANTLGSKAQDTRLTQASVDLKVLVEQMREQVQNIE